MRIIIDITADPALLGGANNMNRRSRLQSHIADVMQPWLDEWLDGIEIEDVTIEVDE